VSVRARHEPVLKSEVVELLSVAPGLVYVDGTLGDGGHAEAILDGSAPDGRLVGLDRDPEALAEARERLARFGARATLRQASFRGLARVLAELALPAVDGVLLDLGVSSHQLDAPERGFRFAEATAAATPLDMRMDPASAVTAASLLATASEAELGAIFARYGELPGSYRLARAIVEARERAPLATVADLLRVIDAAGVGRGRRHHPATLVFQALRIAVNDELAALEEGLGAAIDALRPRGRLVVIAYHSLEDRLVKQRLRAEERGCVCPPRAPVCSCGRRPRLARAVRVRPNEVEISRNPRARSAVLRAAERLAEAA
jgi:16S rRNA (cytosine1402-N4)-methyltransferase